MNVPWDVEGAVCSGLRTAKCFSRALTRSEDTDAWLAREPPLGGSLSGIFGLLFPRF